MLTVETRYFSSQTVIDAFRVCYVTGHNAFESFFDANIMANNIKMVIPSNVRKYFRFKILF